MGEIRGRREKIRGGRLLKGGPGEGGNVEKTTPGSESCEKFGSIKKKKRKGGVRNSKGRRVLKSYKEKEIGTREKQE